MAADVVQRANALIAVRRYDDAIRELSAALASAPNDPDILCTLALAFVRSGRAKEALKYARAGVAAAPDDDWPYRLLSLALGRTGKPKDALAAAFAAQRINPESALVQMTVAEAQLDDKLAEDALVTANRAAALAPENGDVYDTRGRVLLALKRYAEAEADFRHALRLDPTAWAFNNNLGVALRRQGKKIESVQAFERAVKANPGAKTARQNLFGSTSTYIGGGVAILAYVGLRLGIVGLRSTNGFNGSYAVVAGLIVLIGIGWWLVVRNRRRKLSPEVDAFYRSEQRRRRGRYLLFYAVRLGPGVMLFVVAVVAIAFNSPYSGAAVGVVAALAILWWFASIPVWRRVVLPRLDAAEEGDR